MVAPSVVPMFRASAQKREDSDDRPDVIGNAVKVIRLATGAEEEAPTLQPPRRLHILIAFFNDDRERRTRKVRGQCRAFGWRGLMVSGASSDPTFVPNWPRD